MAKCWAEGYAPLTRKIRQYLGPDAIIYANECLDITNPSLNVTEVPPDFDLISVDHCALTTPPPSPTLPRALTAAAVLMTPAALLQMRAIYPARRGRRR